MTTDGGTHDSQEPEHLPTFRRLAELDWSSFDEAFLPEDGVLVGAVMVVKVQESDKRGPSFYLRQTNDLSSMECYGMAMSASDTIMQDIQEGWMPSE